jgi:hypothetical protein
MINFDLLVMTICPCGDIEVILDIVHCLVFHVLCMGEGPEYRPFRDLKSVPEASRPREQVKNHGRACTQVLFLRKVALRFFSTYQNSDSLADTFHWSEDPSPAWLVPSTAEDPP